MTIMYRIIDLRYNTTIGYFFEYDHAENYLKELGLGTNVLIQEVSIKFSHIKVLKRNVR